jgi:fermentation-respiration switch protein FrsA (DUF1100 family)
MPRLLTGFLAAAMICVGAAILAYFVQRSVLFPRSTSFTRPSRGPAERVTLPQGGALFLTPATVGAEPAPLLLFMHGNAETADDWVDQFGEARRHGWAVLLLEYPGYGGTAGSPSEPSIVTAALAAFDWAAHDSRVDSSRIVAYGRSLGTGAATQLATARPVAGLVLESGFTSVRPLAARFLVPDFLVRDPFDNLAQLRKYHGPLLVFHGMEDRVIPMSHGQALAAAVPGATFIALTCGHNDCPRPWQQLFTWLDAHASVHQ